MRGGGERKEMEGESERREREVYSYYNYTRRVVLYINNPRRACARVTVLVLSVCVCVFPILAPRAIRRTNSSISDFSAIRA